jgi:IS605 OrfB family transposase
LQTTIDFLGCGVQTIEMHITLHTILGDEASHSFLEEMAERHTCIEHKLYAAIAAGKFAEKTFKTEFSEKHNLTSRQFNSMALEVKGKISGVRECLKENILVLEARLKTLKGAVSDLKHLIKVGKDSKGRVFGKERMAKKRRNLHEKQRKVDRLQFKILAMQARVDAPAPGICFGSHALFMKQFDEGVSIVEWRKEWQSARKSQFLVVGTGSEETGCASCQATLEADGTITLRLRPFNAMLAKRTNASGQSTDKMKRRKTITAKASDFVVIRGVEFKHGAEYIKDALARNQEKGKRTPLTYRFIRDDRGVWYVHASLSIPDTAIFDTQDGAIGLDFNEDHIAATVVDRHGNFVCCRRFELDLYGLSSLQAKDKIRCVARDVTAWAKSLGLSVIAEDLDFQKKKRSMAAFSAKRARSLSSLHFAAWGQAIQSRCHKDGVALKLVNPAYTSLIGRVKFAASIGLSVHHSAAMVIARRGMNLSERLPNAPVSYPDGVGTQGTLNPVVNTGHRHVWYSWAKVAKAVNAARVARFSVKAPLVTVTELERAWDEEIPTSWAGPGELSSRGDPGEIPGRRPDLPVDGRLSSSGATAPMAGL